MVCHEPNPFKPRPTGQRVCYQPGHSEFSPQTLCSHDDCVASRLFPHHTGCEGYSGTLRAVGSDFCTFNAGTLEYSGKYVTNCVDFKEILINSTENDYHCINRNTCCATNSTADDSGHGRASCIESVDDGDCENDPIGGTATYHVPHRLGIACGSGIGAQS
jgi:hypothetical protein